MKIRILSLLAVALVAAGAAQANGVGPCSAGTVQSVMDQYDCTIGDEIFIFYNYNVSTSGMHSDDSAGAVGFLPLTDDPLAPGFRLTGPFWSSVAAPPFSEASAYVQATLWFSVWTASGDARITGIGAPAVNGWSLATVPDASCPSGDCYSDAQDLIESYLGAPYSYGYFNPYQIQYSGMDPSLIISSAGWPGSPPPTSASYGNAYFETWARSYNYDGSVGGSASASFYSADFRITESAEPGSWMLLGAACVPLLLWGRRARRAK